MATLIRGDNRTATAYQDSIAFNFAFNGKDGIVKGVGSNCVIDISQSGIVGIKSGMVVIQGRQIAIDGTEKIAIPINTGGSTYYTLLFLKLDMSAVDSEAKQGTCTLQKLEYTSSYPDLPPSDDLTVQPDGVAYLALYKFINQSPKGVYGTLKVAADLDKSDIDGEFEKVNNRIDTTNSQLQVLSTRVDNNNTSINQRLDNLGFSEGGVSPLININTTLTKQAKYALLKILPKMEGSRALPIPPTAQTAEMTFNSVQPHQYRIGVDILGSSGLGKGYVLVKIENNQISIQPTDTSRNYLLEETIIGFEIK